MTNDTQRIQHLIQLLKEIYNHDFAQARIIRSPYRICPLGAHIDHQNGVVTGMCIDRNILLVYAPNTSGEVRLRSLNFEGEVRFSVKEKPMASMKHWANYPKGAVFALNRQTPLKFGIDGIIEGNLPIGGLSSSAAVGVAYLLALEDVNELQISPKQNIHLDQLIENEFIGLQNGILDQSTILLSQKNKLFHLDCRTQNYQLINSGACMPDYKIIVVYSGVSKKLTGTGYNLRVAECQEATRYLLEKMNKPYQPEAVLRDIPATVFAQHHNELPEINRKRALHFFSEMKRVEDGVILWQKGDLNGFGRLINASGLSSVENYECGSPHLISIYRILSQLPGVYGARFSGAGFRGSCIGLINPEHTETIIRTIEEEYPKLHPDVKDKFKIFSCNSDEGAKLL